jgi:hypothetical protein
MPQRRSKFRASQNVASGKVTMTFQSAAVCVAAFICRSFRLLLLHRLLRAQAVGPLAAHGREDR